MITHYEVLGVKENATSKEIRKAYKKLVRCLHPDKNVGVNEMVQGLVKERFLEVQEAYATLSDPARRKEYDAALAALRSEGEYYIPVAPSPPAPNPPAKPKEPERCGKCQRIVGEPMHSICGRCCNEIVAMEQEVKARRQLGVTACKLCGCRLSPKSPFPGLCAGCWRHIGTLSKQYGYGCRMRCPRCGREREAGRYCPDCGLDSAGGGTARPRKQQQKQSVPGMWKLVAVWSIVYLAQSLSNGLWIADFFITLALFGLYLFIKKKVGQ
jgi:hypothetical protein